MSEFIIDEFIDLGAAGKQIKEVSANLDALQKQIKDFIPLKNVIESADTTKKIVQATNELAVSENKLAQASNALTISQQQLATSQKSYLASLEGLQEKQIRYKSSLDAVKASIKEYDKQLKAGTITQGEYAASTERLFKNQNLLKAKISEVSKEITAQSKLNISAPGSNNAAKAQNLVLAANRDRATDPARIAEINALIDRNNDLIDKNSSKLEKQRLQIGNYPTVFKGAFTIVEKELEKVNQQLSSGAFKGDALAELTKKQVVLNNVTTSLSSSFTTNTAAATANRNAAKEIGLAFGTNSDVFKKFNKEVSVGTKEIISVDTNIKKATKSGTALGNTFQTIGAGAVRLARLLPGIGIVGLISFVVEPLIAGIGKLINTQSALERKQSSLNAALSEGRQEFVRATLEVQNLKVAFEQARNGIITKEEALKLYNNTIGKTTGEVKDLNDAEQALAKNAEAYIQFTLLKAAANVALGKAAEAAFTAQLEKKKGVTTGDLFEFTDPVARLRNRIKRAEEDKKEFTTIAKDLFDQANAVAQKYKFDFNAIKEPATKKATSGTNKPQKINDDTVQEILRTQFELNKLTIENAIEANKEIIDNEKKTYSERLAALRDYSFNKTALINLERQFEIDSENQNLKKTIDGLEAQKKEKNANIQGLNDQQERERKASAKRIELIEAQSFDKIIDLTKEHIKKQKDLRADQKQVYDDFENDRINAERDLDQKLEELRLKRLKKIEEEEEKKKRLEKEAADYLKNLNKQLLDELQSAFFTFIQNGIDRESQALEERKTIIDKELELRLASIEASGLTEEQRTKKTAEANKQAAFEKEKIDKRQRELAVQRAKFEKAANIAQIIQSTSAAIIEAIKTYKATPLGFSIAAAVGAIGALQLAKAISTPIPKFKTGKNNDYQGLAIVDDGGKREPIYRADTGEIEMAGGPAKDRLTYLGKKDIVWPSVESFMMSMKTPLLPQMKVIKDNSGPDNSVQLDKIVTQLKDLNRKPAAKIIASQGVELSNWYDKNIRN